MAIAVMKEPSCLLAFSTTNYDEMLRFFSDIGFEVTDGTGTQLCPLFNSGRGAYVRHGDFEFNLEESTGDAGPTQCDLWVFDFSELELGCIPYLGFPHAVYEYTRETGLYGRSHMVTGPDGGFRFAHPVDTAVQGMPACRPAFTTGNYDAMLAFFTELGFAISDGRERRPCALFQSGRGAHLKRGDFEFNLEESTKTGAAAAFNLFLLDISEEEIRRIAGLGQYDYTCEQGFFGPSHRLTSPDGGLVTF